MKMIAPKAALAVLTSVFHPGLSLLYPPTSARASSGASRRCTLPLPRWYDHRREEPKPSLRLRHDRLALAPSPQRQCQQVACNKRRGATSGALALFAYSYGRGAEIWPPPIDGDRPLDLSDSFPAGRTPTLEPAEQTGSVRWSQQSPAHIDKSKEEKLLYPRTWTHTALLNSVVRRLLQRAAALDEQDAETTLEEKDKSRRLCFGTVASAVPKFPIALALTAVALGAVRPVDALGVTAATGYLWVLCLASQLTRASDGRTPICPALPPQGHVPLLVRSPLGPDLTNSPLYAAWCQLGVILGLLLPVLLALLVGPAAGSKPEYLASTSCIMRNYALRSVFLQSCQVVTESVVCRRFSLWVPLPVRILVPVLYNALRIPYLWNWVTAGAVPPAATLLLPMRILGLLNLLYSGINLFGFLLPVAVIRYLRAHFLAVEVEQVTLRSGMEDMIGLVPPPS